MALSTVLQGPCITGTLYYMLIGCPMFIQGPCITAHNPVLQDSVLKVPVLQEIVLQGPCITGTCITRTLHYREPVLKNNFFKTILIYFFKTQILQTHAY